MTVTARVIVERVDVISCVGQSELSGLLDVLLDSFLLQAAEERLRDGVVPRSRAASTSTPSASRRGRKALPWGSVATRMMPSPFARAAPANRQTARLRKSWS